MKLRIPAQFHVRNRLKLTDPNERDYPNVYQELTDHFCRYSRITGHRFTFWQRHVHDLVVGGNLK